LGEQKIFTRFLWAGEILSLVKLEAFKNGILKKRTERDKIFIELAIFFQFEIGFKPKNQTVMDEFSFL
jgi:hypothetical protein